MEERHKDISTQLDQDRKSHTRAIMDAGHRIKYEGGSLAAFSTRVIEELQAIQAKAYLLGQQNAERPATEAGDHSTETIGVEENTDSVAQAGATDKRESGEDTL